MARSCRGSDQTGWTPRIAYTVVSTRFVQQQAPILDNPLIPMKLYLFVEHRLRVR